ncbi:MAG: bifunctional metallophosphatase/5'-nucleotidase [Candidatus Electronema sp. VV]
MLKKILAVLCLSCLLAACAAGNKETAPAAPQAASRPVRITLLQMNDVYEIAPVSGGKEGGLARVATLRDRLLAENPNTITVLAGDLFSPSALGTAPYEQSRLAGKQIVAAMNALGLDYITFGNHEFDIKKEQFHERLKESQFKWISSNCFDQDGKAFPAVLDSKIIEVQGVKVGIFGVTLDSNKADYVSYKDPFVIAQEKIAELRPKTDVLIALTHLSFQDDIALANRFPELDLILGGHEHENMQLLRGKDFTPIFKADANARTVYVHELRWDKAAAQPLSVSSRLERVTDALPEQEKTAKAVAAWQQIGYDGFRKAGFEPERTVTVSTEELDGLEASVRNRSTRLTELIAQGMLHAAPGAELSICNSGSIRIDDVLPAGKITEYDVIRILPFGGDIVTTKMKGSLLRKTLDQGLKNKGGGSYLQTANVSGGNGQPWLINGKKLDEKKTYSVAIAEYLLKVGDSGLEFLVKNPGAPVLKSKGDIRKALIAELQKVYGE